MSATMGSEPKSKILDPEVMWCLLDPLVSGAIEGENFNTPPNISFTPMSLYIRMRADVIFRGIHGRTKTHKTWLILIGSRSSVDLKDISSRVFVYGRVSEISLVRVGVSKQKFKKKRSLIWKRPFIIY